MADTNVFVHFAAALKGGVVLAVVLHVLAIVPQWLARYFHPRLLNTSAAGLMLAVAHGAVIALAGVVDGADGAQRSAALMSWCLLIALLVNLVVGGQNLLAVIALLRLHRGSALVAYSLRGAIRPLIWLSGALTAAAYALASGWL